MNSIAMIERRKSMRMVKIDGDKLYTIFKKRGLVISEICKTLGVNVGYFANARKRGTLSELSVNALESMYNIKKEDIVIDDNVSYNVGNVQTTNILTEEWKDELYKVIYSAVYHAVHTALNE